MIKRALYDEICSNLTLDRSSVDLVVKKYPGIDPEILMAIYMRHSLSTYRAAHARLTAQDLPLNHFYTNFRMKCSTFSAERSHWIIKEMGEEVGLPPCLMARLVLKSFLHAVSIEENVISSSEFISVAEDSNTNLSENKAAKQSTARITELLRNPESIRDQDAILTDNLIFCLQNDFLTSPMTDQYRHQIGVEREVFMHERLRQLGVLFHSEADMRAAGYPKTPDALLAYPVEIGGHIVNWIESKALFSDIPTHQTYLREQYWPYFNRFGPGLVIYWYGFIEEISNDREREKGILVMDGFPEKIKQIQIQLLTTIFHAAAMMEDEEVISFSSKIIESSSELHPIAEILDNLKNDDLALRLGALKRLNGEVNCLA